MPLTDRIVSTVDRLTGAIDRIFGYGPRKAGDTRETIEAYFARPGVWVKVSSSNVDSIAYYDGRDRKVLGVRFHGGTSKITEYHYYDVGQSLFQEMLRTGSKGKFVWAKLRDVYSYKRIG